MRAEPVPRERAAAIRLVCLDVDGVMTGGGVTIGAAEAGSRLELKRFDITDGIGVKALQANGIEVAIVTGRTSDAVRLRAGELGVKECHQGASTTKQQVVAAILERRGLAWDAAAFLGDDLVDVPVMRHVGLPAAVANAVAEVRAEARWIARRAGGRGAVREFAEAILRARGQWRAYVESRTAVGVVQP